MEAVPLSLHCSEKDQGCNSGDVYSRRDSLLQSPVTEGSVLPRKQGLGTSS